MANYEREDKYDLEKIEQLKYDYREVLLYKFLKMEVFQYLI